MNKRIQSFSFALIATLIFFVNSNLLARIIYTDPVQNAKYVSINNNIIIGLDDEIRSTDMNSLIKVTGTLSGEHSGEIIITSDNKKFIFKPHAPFLYKERVDVTLRHLKTSTTSNTSITYSFYT